MKKLMILVGIGGALTAQAGEVVRTPLQDYVLTENYAMFEIKTPKFQKVILDCQGFNMGVYFYNNSKIQTQVHMDEPDCEEFHQFLTESNDQHRAVCLELDADANFLEVTDKKEDDCK